MGFAPENSGSHRTRRWREWDSNRRSLSRTRRSLRTGSAAEAKRAVLARCSPKKAETAGSPVAAGLRAMLKQVDPNLYLSERFYSGKTRALHATHLSPANTLSRGRWISDHGEYRFRRIGRGVLGVAVVWRNVTPAAPPCLPISRRISLTALALSHSMVLRQHETSVKRGI
jgi:hypothetical protein